MSGTAIIYYVVGYSEMREKIQNFRLDRIYRTPELLAEEPQIPAPTFCRWVFGWGGDMKILGPENVKEKYKAMARNAAED